jgi:hypothetical protein
MRSCRKSLITFSLGVSTDSDLDVSAGWERHPTAYTLFGAVRTPEREAGPGHIVGWRRSIC